MSTEQTDSITFYVIGRVSECITPFEEGVQDVVVHSGWIPSRQSMGRVSECTLILFTEKGAVVQMLTEWTDSITFSVIGRVTECNSV